MEITTLLAQVWGPAILAVGFGVFASRAHYIRVYRDLEQSSLAVLTFGTFAMMLGVLQVLFHNVWSTLPEIIVSILGWGLLVKGAVFIIAPRFVDKAGDAWADKKLIPIAGAAMLLLGCYLIWYGYIGAV